MTAKIVQTEDNTKYKTVFYVFFNYLPLTLPKSRLAIVSCL